MTDFSDILCADAVLTGVPGAGKKALLAHLGLVAGPLVGVDGRVVTERLAERERLGSTGFGGGVAIPHAKVDGVASITGVFVRLAQPIDYAAVDELPVDLVFAMLSPPAAGAEHLKALARVSRRLRDTAFLAKLRGAGSRDAIFALFTDAA